MALCPYCHAPLAKIPKAKTFCRSCGNPIHVRARRSLFPGTVLFSADDAHAIDWLIRLGVSRADFEAHRQELTRQFGQSAKTADVLWRIFNESLERTSDWHARQMTYWNMALFVYAEGRECLHLKQQAVKMQLAAWQDAADRGVFSWETTKLKVITCGVASCTSCAALEGATFTFAEASERMPIPVSACTTQVLRPPSGKGPASGWCRCTYGLDFGSP